MFQSTYGKNGPTVYCIVLVQVTTQSALNYKTQMLFSITHSRTHSAVRGHLGFNVLPKATLACALEELGIEPATLGLVGVFFPKHTIDIYSYM